MHGEFILAMESATTGPGFVYTITASLFCLQRELWTNANAAVDRRNAIGGNCLR